LLARILRERHVPLLAIYAACVLLVCSFILFEVLDIDGSDFPPPTRALRFVSPVEAPHDFKRTVTHGPTPIAVPTSLRVSEGTSDPARVQRILVERSALRAGTAPSYLVLLPRSSLPDPSSAA